MTAIIITLIALMLSCKKVDEIPDSIQKVRIFVSSPSSQDGLKSATTNSTQTEISNGDTIIRPENINLIMNTTDEHGYPISGRWRISLIFTDYSFMSNYKSTYPGSQYFGDQIANKYLEIGLYEISFGNVDPQNENPFLEQFHCYLQIGSIPGKLGDGGSNNFIFRFEKKIIFDLNTYQLKSFLFAYYKYAKKGIKLDQAYCMLFDKHKDDLYYESILPLKKWPFNKDYYYLVIDPDKEGSLGSYKLLYLVFEDGGTSRYIDPNCYFSSWADQYGQIEFAVY